MKPKSEKPVQKRTRGTSRSNTTFVDNYDRLSDESKAWHESLIRDTPHTPGRWKIEFAKKVITGSFCDSCFKCLEDWKQEKNKRIYIGPGKDSSSNDKISIECRFNPVNNYLTYCDTCKGRDYRKTTFELHDGEWICTENKVDVKRERHYTQSARPSKLN